MEPLCRSDASLREEPEERLWRIPITVIFFTF